MIYLDNAATTRMRPEVRAAMEPFFDQDYGNASSLHAAGRRARRALEDAREVVASCLGADPKEIVFTSGATESNALAIAGAAEALRGRGDHLVTSAIEHPSVLEAFARLERQGWRVTRVPVDALGLVDPARVSAALTPKTVLLSVMAVASPTAPATFSVPARRSNSWPPPASWAASGVPFRIRSTPTPFGPWILCAETVRRSASRPSAATLP